MKKASKTELKWKKYPAKAMNAYVLYSKNVKNVDNHKASIRHWLNNDQIEVAFDNHIVTENTLALVGDKIQEIRLLGTKE